MTMIINFANNGLYGCSAVVGIKLTFYTCKVIKKFGDCS